MSKVIIFSFSPVFDENQWKLLSYYEGISKAFLKRGHKVLNIITNNFIIDPWNGDNISISKYIAEDTLNKIHKFNPDLIITFNNSKLENIEKNVDCPIVICEADRWFYFSNKSEIKKNINRYHFFYFTKNGKTDFIKHFGANKNKIFYLENATSLKNKKIKKTTTINFIGTLYDTEYLQKKIEINNAKFRFDILNKLKKFKPDIYTNNIPSMYKSLKEFINIKKIYNTFDTEKIYNQSFMSLNISNFQSKNVGFSWRLLDIMATNSLLISEKNPEIEKRFSDLSKRQFYETPHDCYKNIQFFLNNKSSIPELISLQNEYIKENYTWEDRIKKIEEIYSLKVDTTKKNRITPNIKILNRSKIIKFDYYVSFIVFIIKFFKKKLIISFKHNYREFRLIKKIIKKIKFALTY